MSNFGKLQRCDWALQYDIYLDYHDQEWGVPIFDNPALYKMLMLESMQAGLSWRLILDRRAGMSQRVDNFNPEKIANYGASKIAELLADPIMIRNKLKINALVNNAQAYLELLEQGTSLSELIWEEVDHKPIINNWQRQADVPTHTELSDQLTKKLKAAGFKFVGTTIVYSFMQAVGVVNDHLVSCYRHEECSTT